MQYTGNYNLKKPEGTDVVNIGDINDNMDSIDLIVNNIHGKLFDKVDRVENMGLSSNDYTTTEKNKLAGIATGANNYSHPTTAGNKHIPTGGAAGQILKYSASGTATWAAENVYTHPGSGTNPHGTTKDDVGLGNVLNAKQFWEGNYGFISVATGSAVLGLTHANSVVLCSNTSAMTITIPNNTSVLFPTGTQITVLAGSNQSVSFVPATGVSLFSKDSKRVIDGMYAGATLVKTAANQWILFGALK